MVFQEKAKPSTHIRSVALFFRPWKETWTGNVLNCGIRYYIRYNICSLTGLFQTDNVKGATKLYFMHCQSLVCSIRIYKSLRFLLVLLKIQFFFFLCSAIFVSSVLNSMSSLKAYSNCFINIYAAKCSVILFSLYINYLYKQKRSRQKKYASRELVSLFCKKLYL